MHTKLAVALLAAGYRFGAPRTVQQAAREIDAEVLRQMVCPCCRNRGLSYVPFHRGEKYRVLARCERCQAAEEV